MHNIDQIVVAISVQEITNEEILRPPVLIALLLSSHISEERRLFNVKE